MKILMVCLGNICRSPMAEGLMRAKILKYNLQAEVDSAGFEPFHVNDKPDYRACDVMLKHGINISNQRARLFKLTDFEYFDRIYVMDSGNYRDVLNTASNTKYKEKVDYLLNTVFNNSNKHVPDPYYGKMNDFEDVYSLIEKATEAIAMEIKNMQK